MEELTEDRRSGLRQAKLKALVSGVTAGEVQTFAFPHGAALIDALEHILGRHRAGEHRHHVLADVHPLRVEIVDRVLVDDRLGRIGIQEFLLLGRPLGLQPRDDAAR